MHCKQRCQCKCQQRSVSVCLSGVGGARSEVTWSGSGASGSSTQVEAVGQLQMRRLGRTVETGWDVMSYLVSNIRFAGQDCRLGSPF